MSEPSDWERLRRIIEPAVPADREEPAPGPEPGCPGCRFVRGWGAVYRAVWEAGDRHGDLYDLAEDLAEEAVDREQLRFGLLRCSQALDELEAALGVVQRSVACFGPEDGGPPAARR